jgi:hypothetical protein
VCKCVCVNECDHEASIMRRPRPDRAVEPREKSPRRNVSDKYWLYVCFIKVHFNEYSTN